MSAGAGVDSLEPWTIGRVLTWSTQFLRERGLVDSPRLDAELLLAHTLGLTRIKLYTNFDQPLTPAERDPFKALLKRRSVGEPVAYLTGSKEFMGYTFTVSPAVLIPRPDTESLVEHVLATLKAESKQQGRTAPWRLLDVGTGSGCIAISLALKLPGSVVEAWDCEAAALAVARANGERLAAPVTWAAVDALQEASWTSPADSGGDATAFDAIIANPPYISHAEAKDLPVSVLSFEPGSALFAADDGLAFYHVLARWAPRRLRSDGWLAVEIGSTQAEAVSGILRNAGWQDVAVVKDLGRLDRIVTARWRHAH